MKLAKFLLIPAVVLGLAACSSVQHEYVQFRDKHEAYHPTAKSVAPTKGINQEQVQKNYNVKPLNNPEKVKQVPLTPPGSDLQSSSKTQNVQGYIYKVTFNTAWKKVGKAIRQSGYQILDQDNGLGTYYVLDTKSTSGKIKQNTPIYQLHLTKVKQGTKLTLLSSGNELAKADIANRILGSVIASLK